MACAAACDRGRRAQRAETRRTGLILKMRKLLRARWGGGLSCAGEAGARPPGRGARSPAMQGQAVGTHRRSHYHHSPERVARPRRRRSPRYPMTLKRSTQTQMHASARLCAHGRQLACFHAAIRPACSSMSAARPQDPCVCSGPPTARSNIGCRSDQSVPHGPITIPAPHGSRSLHQEDGRAEGHSVFEERMS